MRNASRVILRGSSKSAQPSFRKGVRSFSTTGSFKNHRAVTRTATSVVIFGGLAYCAMSTLSTADTKQKQASNPPAEQEKASNQASQKALNGEWREFEITKVSDESHDTKRIRFSLWNRHEQFGLETAGAILIRKPPSTWKDQEKPEMRPYTPVIVNDDEGWVELIVKVYPQGVLSPYIAGQKVGDKLEIKGPLPKIKITPNLRKNFTMLAGGTGVTPMYQILNKVLEYPDDKTDVTLIISQKSDKDLLLKQELETLAKKHSDRIHLNWVISNKQGHIDRPMLEKLMPCTDGEKCGKDGLVFVCGPPAFYKAYSGEKKSPADQGPLTGILADMKFTSNDVYKL
eukprot:TRINITY_DN3070_c0_g1_i1.p1 TRINITY_DN3070_c0_g1~~TRINITY_DN3070_c0_g1_i1.p1  ORF type:complete len:343 (+),score=78.32 TRINITY_DN3070_c0_g1_i1:78-1106(+)